MRLLKEEDGWRKRSCAHSRPAYGRGRFSGQPNMSDQVFRVNLRAKLMSSEGEQALASDRTDGDPQPIGWNGSELKSLWAIARDSTRQALETPPAETPPSLVAAKVQRFFLWNAGQSDGPHPREELEKRVADGHLKPHEFVKPEGEDEWIPVSVAINRADTAPPRKWGALANPVAATIEPVDRNVEKLPVGCDTSPIVAATNIAEKANSPIEVERPAPSRRAEVAAAVTAPPRTAAKASDRRPAAGSSLTHVQSSPLVRLARQAWTKAEQTVGRENLRRGLIALAVTAAMVTYFVWPPSSSSIYESFMRCRVEMEAVQNKGGASTEWQQFASAHRPKVESLVTTLRDRAGSGRPADQELLWAGERCLLPILKDGPASAAALNQLFGTHMRNARRLLDGAPPAAEATASASGSSNVATAAPVFYSPTPPGAPAAGGPALGSSTSHPGPDQPAASRGRN